MGKPLASPSLGESRRADEHKGQQPDSAPGSCFKPDTEVGATWTAILPLCPGSCPKMEPPGVGSDCPALLQGPHCCCRGYVSTLPCGFWISRWVDLHSGACHLRAGVEKIQVSQRPGVCTVARDHVCKRSGHTGSTPFSHGLMHVCWYSEGRNVSSRAFSQAH